MIEVELKVALNEPIEKWKGILEQTLQVPCTLVDKRDIYYKRGDFFFRLRKEGDTSFLTFKKKSLQAGVEVNQERETSLGSRQVFSVFLENLELAPLYEKTKKGYSFQWEDLTLELLEVGSLGLFLEIEILLEPSASEKERKEANHRLKKMLFQLGISEEAIEDLPYQTLLGF